MKRFSLGMVVFLFILALSITPTVNASGGGPKFERARLLLTRQRRRLFHLSKRLKSEIQERYAKYFSDAAAEFNVPVELLLAIGYAESRWQDHKGKPKSAQWIWDYASLAVSS